MNTTNVDQQIVECAARLEKALRDDGRSISQDGRTSEANAAWLIGVAAGTMRNWRSTHLPIPWHRVGSRYGRVTYALGDLAAHLVRGRTDA